MSRHADERAPVELTPIQVHEIRNHPEITPLQEERDSIANQARAQFGTIKTSQGTEVFMALQAAEANLQSAKMNLRRATLRRAREEYFNTTDTKEINAQLDLDLSRLDLGPDEWQPQILEHELEERRILAHKTCQDPAWQEGFTEETERAELERRIKTIDAMVVCCTKQDVRPHNDKQSVKLFIPTVNIITDAEMTSASGTDMTTDTNGATDTGNGQHGPPQTRRC